MSIDLTQDPDFVRETYSPPPHISVVDAGGGGAAVTSINGLSGPSVNVTGGTTGLSFGTAAPNIVLGGILALANGGTGASTAAGAKVNLGIPLTRTTNVAPSVNDDSSLGYSTHSHWIDTLAQQEYVCVSAAVGAAVWKQTTA
jgi:hypothetical protein